MSSASKICLIGDIVVDVTLKTSKTELKLRLGGIIHAARCLWALNIPFAIRYFSPSYLDKQILSYLESLGCNDVVKFGDIIGAPYVFLIEEVKEVGDQGYEFLLRDEIELEYNEEALENFGNEQLKDYLLIAGNYDLIKVASQIKGNVHIDLANNFIDFTILDSLGKKASTLFISTSSNLFKDFYSDDFKTFSALFEKYAERMILKENRGGSRGFEFSTGDSAIGPAQTRPIIHSVGVGDVYDATYISSFDKNTFEEAMVLSSWVAAEYAITTFPDDFKRGVGRLKNSNLREIVALGGVMLPWETRETINIYIAAPDFDFVDTSFVDILCDSLLYHNFKPPRPIKEHGQMERNAPKARKQHLFTLDMALLNECDILVAVLLYDDPGTLIEIGIAAAKGMPTIVFDPLRKATNCMLTELPTLVTDDLDEIMTEIFIQSANLKLR
jgi:nucleoside 2-deoxyribosyltransferase